MSSETTITPVESQKAPITEPVLWCKLMILSTEWEIWITDDKMSPDLEASEGMCLYTKCRILIDRTLLDSRKLDVLTHEIMHAVIELGGFKKLLPGLFGKSKVDWEEREEILISTFGVNLHDTLMRNGLLTYPEIPESVRVSARSV